MMGEFEQTQSATKSERQGKGREYVCESHEIREGVLGILDFVDLINEKNDKLSGLIDAIRAINQPEVPLENCGWAMHDYTDAIKQLTAELWDRVKSMEKLQDKGCTDTITESERQGTKRVCLCELREIRGGAMGLLDILGFIDQKNAKLSGIIDAIRAINHTVVPLGNCGWAMLDYTDAIEQLTEDLLGHVKSMGILQDKGCTDTM